ncbi:hypothetical protein AMS68_002666 [Peltaster fructicola]|uniref:DUF7730 domain-containing protein n=1 Tax=Peltaster fructicola TaxID=286661 RepID=A0A6H0XR94_9PEZI|nr:hypothetical protein AMS68_002666 [Peltaster fructicola]
MGSLLRAASDPQHHSSRMTDPPRRSARQLAARAEKPASQISRKRPSRLLNSAWTRKDTLASRNAAESPLLRLPPEIKNQIYGYVLGGNEVHVWPQPTHGSDIIVSVCKELESEWQFSSNIRYTASRGLNLRETSSFWLRHYACVVGCKHNRLSLDLRVLLVCRQIHNEACLIPFTHNTFLVYMVDGFRRWQARLIPAQLRAVQSIIAHFDVYSHDLPPSVAKDLPRLQRLCLYYELDAYSTIESMETVYKQAAEHLGGHKPSWERLAAKHVQVAMTFQFISRATLYADTYDDAFEVRPSCADEACATIEAKIASNY